MVDPFRSLMQLTASYVYNASNWLNVYHIDFIYWCWMVWLRTIIHEILNSLFPWKMCFIPSMFKFSCLFLTLTQKDRSSIFALSVLPSNSNSFSDRSTFFLQRFQWLNASWSKYLRIVSPRRLYLKRKSKLCILYMYT